MKATITLMDNKTINLELNAEMAPISVANFVKLAEASFYNGTIFHRVIKDFMIQGGGMTTEMEQKSAANVKGEFTANGVNNTLSHKKGTLSMARAQDFNSGSSQFFICSGDAKFLDGQYAAFGKVADDASLDVVMAISEVKTGNLRGHGDVPKEQIVIKEVTIIK